MREEEIMPKKKMNDLICRTTVYITPEKIKTPTEGYFGGQIPLDPATEPDNPMGASFFCTKETADVFEIEVPDNWDSNGLEYDWSAHDGVFVNPPYGKEIKFWCEKIYEEAVKGTTIVALLPAGPRFSTRYFQSFVLRDTLEAICFVRGRVKFLRPDGSTTKGQNPYDSMLMGFNVNAKRFAKYYGELGRVLEVKALC